MVRAVVALFLVTLVATGLCSCFRQWSTYCKDGTVVTCTCPDGREFEVVCPETCDCDAAVPDGSHPDGSPTCDEDPGHCGDGILCPPEQCDDGQNGDPCDGCLDTCEAHASICGDALLCDAEICDDGVNDGDLGSCGVGCSSGPPAQLAFLQEPSDGTPGVAINPSPSVLVQDAGGRRVLGSSIEVTMTLGVDPTEGLVALTGHGPEPALDGLAVFPSLTLDTPAVAYSLEAESPPLASATSAPFTIRSPVAWPPALDDWQYRKRIVIPSRTRSASLDDFPVLVDLPSDPDLRDRARPDGHDIRFTDGSDTPLVHETESYEGGTGALLAWVRIPTLDTSADTVLFMYYGNSSAATDPSDASVWSNGYVAVWHLAESGSGVAGEYVDATGSGNDATGGAGTSSAAPARQPAAIGMGQSCDGVDDLITTPVSLNGLGRSSVTLWVYLRDVTSTARPGLVGQNNAMEMGFYWSDRLNVWTPGMTVDCPGKGVESLCTPDFPLATWFHLAISWDGTEGALYVDGVEQHRVPATTGSSAFFFNMMGQIFDGSGNHLDGILDEVRLADTDRSGAWLEHEHANQADPGAFYVVGPEEPRP